jgi:hypothetical protein
MLVIRNSACPASGSDISVPEPPAALNGHGHAAAQRYAAELARGQIPGIRRIRRDLHVGQPRAQQVRAYLAVLTDNTTSAEGG